MFYTLESPELRACILKGGIGILPTDTVYGIVASAGMPSSIARMYSIKQRDKKPGTLLAASIDQLVGLGIKKRYLRAVEQFWPGATSVVIPCPDIEYLHLGLNSLAVRIPDDDKLLSLLSEVGPLQTSSANRAGQPVATNIESAQMIFVDDVDFYVDGGDLSSRQPSTIVRIDDDAITVLRQGAGYVG